MVPAGLADAAVRTICRAQLFSQSRSVAGRATRGDGAADCVWRRSGCLRSAAGGEVEEGGAAEFTEAAAVRRGGPATVDDLRVCAGKGAGRGDSGRHRARTVPQLPVSPADVVPQSQSV